MSTATTIYDQLRAAIIDGTFSSGELLCQDLIARDYGFSKIPVREALIQLEADGFVELFSGRGAFVVRFSTAQAEEIYLVRLALEPILLQRAIPLTAEIDWLRAGGILAALQSNDLSFRQVPSLDHGFHSALYRQTGLPTMTKLVANFYSNLACYYRLHETVVMSFRGEGRLNILRFYRRVGVGMRHRPFTPALNTSPAPAKGCWTHSSQGRCSTLSSRYIQRKRAFPLSTLSALRISVTPR